MNGIQLAGIDWAILCIYFAFSLGYLPWGANRPRDRELRAHNVVG